MRSTNSDPNLTGTPIAEAAVQILRALGIPVDFVAAVVSPSSASPLSARAARLGSLYPADQTELDEPIAPNGRPDQAEKTANVSAKGRVPVICVVGAGGKSTTTFSLATALAEQGRRVVISTTTKMGHDQTGGLTVTPPNIVAVAQALWGPGVCLVVEHPDPASPKVVGPSTVWLDELADSGLVDAIVLEADGARRRNAKAPAPHEPVLPSSTSHVVTLLGADALDRVIEDQGHRPMRIAAAAGCGPYDRLSAARAARLIISDIGGRKGVTETMGFCAVLTKVADDNRENAEITAELVQAAGFAIVLVPFDVQAGSVVRPKLPANLGT
jgi:probable selenium-dependent hydroxylase accessory protein YqeC